VTKQPMMRIDPLNNVKVANALAASETPSLSVLHETVGCDIDVDLLQRLQLHALKTYKDDNELDRWLAPRLHSAVRIPRATAADPGVWTWMAVAVLKPYMERRWPVDLSKKVPWWRYNDRGILRNGVSRLWWAAELVRSGPDYSLVPAALRASRVFQNVGELRYSWHRECARSFTRILDEYHDLGDELSVLFNAYLATQCLEVFDYAPSALEFTGWDPDWAVKTPTFKELLSPVASLEGPGAGYSRASVEEALYRWLKDVIETVVTIKI
jgi:hypothetical protein